VWIERDGALVGTPLLLRIDEVELLIERVLAPLGRRVDPVSPMVDARLADGSRVNVVVPPLAVDGPCMTIRRFSVRALSLDDLAAPPVAELLRWAVSARSNVVVVGATGSGKTTLLNALAGEVGAAERIITVEDAAELRLPGPHVVRLEARPPSADGVGAVSLRDLVRNALRMRPDRVIVGEVRGPEALDMLQALNTGHDGSLSTCHANGPDDGLRRLETLVLTAGTGLPLDAVRDQLAAAVDLVIHVARGAGGARRVAAVTEVPPPEARGEGRLVGRLLTSVDGRRVVDRLGRRRRRRPRRSCGRPRRGRPRVGGRWVGRGGRQPRTASVGSTTSRRADPGVPRRAGPSVAGRPIAPLGRRGGGCGHRRTTRARPGGRGSPVSARCPPR